MKPSMPDLACTRFSNLAIDDLETCSWFLEICAAFICATAVDATEIFLVAINPPMSFQSWLKNKLPVCTASTWVPNGSGGAGSLMAGSFSRCSRLDGQEPSRGYHVLF
jgi:hypothetical protein